MSNTIRGAPFPALVWPFSVGRAISSGSNEATYILTVCCLNSFFARSNLASCLAIRFSFSISGGFGIELKAACSTWRLIWQEGQLKFIMRQEDRVLFQAFWKVLALRAMYITWHLESVRSIDVKCRLLINGISRQACSSERQNRLTWARKLIFDHWGIHRQFNGKRTVALVFVLLTCLCWDLGKFKQQMTNMNNALDHQDRYSASIQSRIPSLVFLPVRWTVEPISERSP